MTTDLRVARLKFAFPYCLLVGVGPQQCLVLNLYALTVTLTPLPPLSDFSQRKFYDFSEVKSLSRV